LSLSLGLHPPDALPVHFAFCKDCIIINSSGLFAQSAFPHRISRQWQEERCDGDIQDGNDDFCVIGQFPLDTTRTRLIACFEIAATVTASREIRVLCGSCFFRCETLSRLNFETGSELRHIDRLSFGEGFSLHTIRIPSSIESLERKWFLHSHFHGGVGNAG
jgi:hypothetical protein